MRTSEREPRLRVVPSDHSLERMNERSVSMAPAELAHLIEDAIACGRTSRRRPRCVPPLKPDEALRVARRRWAWTDGRELVFPLDERPGGVLVAATVLRRDRSRRTKEGLYA